MTGTPGCLRVRRCWRWSREGGGPLPHGCSAFAKTSRGTSLQKSESRVSSSTCSLVSIYIMSGPARQTGAPSKNLDSQSTTAGCEEAPSPSQVGNGGGNTKVLAVAPPAATTFTGPRGVLTMCELENLSQIFPRTTMPCRSTVQLGQLHVNRTGRSRGRALRRPRDLQCHVIMMLCLWAEKL